MNENIECWTVCDMCEDYFCNVHDMHAADCPCPGVDYLYGIDFDPYINTTKEYKETVEMREEILLLITHMDAGDITFNEANEHLELFLEEKKEHDHEYAMDQMRVAISDMMDD